MDESKLTKEEEAKIPNVPAKENPGHSTDAAPGMTGDRTPTERRTGSGNTRTGAVEAREDAGETGQ
jgi:hypothetical protein